MYKKTKTTNQAPSRPPAIRPPTSASTDNINGIPRKEGKLSNRSKILNEKTNS